MKSRYILTGTLVVLIIALSFLLYHVNNRPAPLTEMQKDSIYFIKTNKNIKLNTEFDSLAYALGMYYSSGVEKVINSSNDSNGIYDLCYGFLAGTRASSVKKQEYLRGQHFGNKDRQIASSLNKDTYKNDTRHSISKEMFLAGFIYSLLPNKKSIKFNSNYYKILVEEQIKGALSIYSWNKKKGEKFLANNRKKPDITVLPSGLQYKIIQDGNGVKPQKQSLVKINYESRTIDGKIFDSSYIRGEPVELRIDLTIYGIEEALIHMSEGSVWEIYIPQNLAYGYEGQGPIKPFSALILKIELLKVY